LVSIVKHVLDLPEVYQDIDVELDVDRVVEGPPFTKWVQNEETENRVREIIEEHRERVFSLVEPRSVQRVLSRDGSGIEGYSPPEGLLESDYLAVGVVTIGREIYENPVRSKVDSGEERMSLDLLVVDALENIILDKALREVALEIKELAGDSGFNTTRVVPPGSGRVDWGVENQEFIFQHVDAGQIGVKLESTNAITPQKTLSFVMGLGSEIKDITDIFSCRGCPRMDCPYRAE